LPETQLRVDWRSVRCGCSRPQRSYNFLLTFDFLFSIRETQKCRPNLILD
jgi:hypothetical protein